jgi:feruloyl esterase
MSWMVAAMKGITLKRVLAAASLSLALGALMAASAVASPCEALAKRAFQNAVITLAVPVDVFVPPGSARADAFRSLPPFCRVAATLTPTPDSDIKMEVWLPVSGWNGKFMAVGNGAFSGAIGYAAMAASLARGYAVSSTDTGHGGGSASFALGHPEKLVDFGWRAVHDMTATAKNIVAAYYGTGPKFSFWNGCSAGGRQAMKEAQRFPADFDGIIAGAPGLDWTSRAAQALRVEKQLQTSAASRLLGPQLESLHKAVLDACDGLDGVKDGLIADPDRCTFDPSVLQCKASESGSCLTAEQVDTARFIYASPKNPKTGRAITGLARGSELGWTDEGWTASARATGLDQFRFIVFRNPKWEVADFNFDSDIVRAEETDADIINALNPDLTLFFDRGGKLIQYHGWSDPQISPGNSTQYYNRVVDKVGDRSKVHASYRLFMVPGMAHCGGGEGPNTFDMIAALERWVENGSAPDQIIATHSTNGKTDRTRPLCPYPQIASYKGTGSIDDAANFVCRAQ